MKREIKFRAWDNKRKEMFWPSMLCTYSDDNTLPLQTIRFQGDSKNDFVLMQYCGLKDKNGVEIYEGDIFNRKRDKASLSGGYIASTYAYHPENAKVVEWRDGAFRVGQTTLATFLGFIRIPGHEQDLIGNIYEHPELLK